MPGAWMAGRDRAHTKGEAMSLQRDVQEFIGAVEELGEQIEYWDSHYPECSCDAASEFEQNARDIWKAWLAVKQLL